MAEKSGTGKGGGVVVIAICSVALALGAHRLIEAYMVRDAGLQFEGLRQELLDVSAKTPVAAKFAEGATEAERKAAAAKAERIYRETVQGRVNKIVPRLNAVQADMRRSSRLAAELAVVIAVGFFFLATAVFMRQQAAAASPAAPAAVAAAFEEESPTPAAGSEPVAEEAPPAEEPAEEKPE